MGHTFTVYNACPFTICWTAAASSSVSFSVPDNWSTGRIWIPTPTSVTVGWLPTALYLKGRRDCDFSTNPGPNSCLGGGCDGGLLCDAPLSQLTIQWPAYSSWQVNMLRAVSPPTVADFTSSTDPGVPDYYGVSLVNGYDLPMLIDNNAGCGVPLGGVDLGPNCPVPLQGPSPQIVAQEFTTPLRPVRCQVFSIIFTSPFVSGMPKAATSQKGSNKKHTSTTAAGTSQSRARQAAASAAKKNSHHGSKLRKKLSHQQATQTRDLLDAEFRDLRAKASKCFHPSVDRRLPRADTLAMGQQEDPQQREGAATTAGFSARISEGSVQDLAGIMSTL
ncbi:hypothetical protein BJY52DRAFT_1415520 [Lactarius psammicola]|nr:hypothetical protein BJY52DRAFT_1415520 [Lactarius psammicola]